MIRSGHPTRAAAALTAAVAVLLVVSPGTAPVHAEDSVDATLRIDTARPLGTVNDDLVGLGWHEGGAPLSTVEALQPHLIRVDASLQDVSTSRDGPLHLDPLLGRISAIRSIGAEPLVILSYLPAWLGEERAFGRDPTRVRPSDLDAWEHVVHDVVHTLATAAEPALVFEAWNEPDVPLFWQDTPVAWLDTVERSARAVAAVEAETGLDLRFGGPATAVPDPAYLVPFLQRFRDPALPLDFVSWHYYGNYPFFGPDGAEFPVTEPIQPVLGRPNPLASPAAYGPQIDFVRTLVETTLAGAGKLPPALVLDEWNLSAAGFDRRHDTAAGAAFATGVLVEMQDAGLDAAAYFRANDTRGVAGEHGLVRTDGSLKPAWWAFRLFRSLAPTRLAVEPERGLVDDTWALASTDGRRITLLLSRFSADQDGVPPTRLRIIVEGNEIASARVLRIDGDHLAAVRPEPLAVEAGGIEVSLPRPGVALLELAVTKTTTGQRTPDGRTSAASDGSSTPEQLPSTGGSSAGLAAALLLIAGTMLRHAIPRIITPDPDGGSP